MRLCTILIGVIVGIYKSQLVATCSEVFKTSNYRYLNDPFACKPPLNVFLSFPIICCQNSLLPQKAKLSTWLTKITKLSDPFLCHISKALYTLNLSPKRNNTSLTFLYQKVFKHHLLHKCTF